MARRNEAVFGDFNGRIGSGRGGFEDIMRHFGTREKTTEERKGSTLPRKINYVQSTMYN